MNFKLIETNIIKYSKAQKFEDVDLIEQSLTERLKQLDYIMFRFLDDFSEKVESDEKCYKFNKVKSEEYSELNRLLRVIKAYKK